MQDEITNAINNKAVTSWVNGPWAIRFYGGVNNANPNLKVIIKTIINQITSLVELQMPPCDGIYPTDSNFVPTSCDPSCSWACDTGFTQCGDRSCIDPTLQTCSSGIPISNSKRALLPQCGANQIVCPVGKGWECLDTTSNLEACGGCPGQKSSVDCSTLPGVSDVQCRDSQCVAYRCARGYTLKNGKCVVAKRHW
jgi:hypothetical protein